MSGRMKAHRVAILALDAVLPLDLGIPAQIFRSSRASPYSLTVCGLRPEVATTAGFSLLVPGDLGDVRRADTVIVPGFWPPERELPDEVLDTLAEAYARGRRLVSICTGAFALAAAGVLDGLRAATHWQEADLLAARYPAVTVDPRVLYVDEGTVLTSAGVSSGIDLCLHVVRRDLGAAAANAAARRLVAAPHREGGQAQFIERPVESGDARRAGVSLAPTRDWALHHLDQPLTVRDLAAHAGVSERTFARRFRAETGVPPLQWLLRARIDRARELLETGNLSVDQVAARTGTGTAANLRLHFRRLVGTTPTSYRRSFRAS
jgi:transcriptional regulator GlxA family with amidase domain